MNKLPINLLVTHFYNEEYLLPFWINYHKKLPINNVVLIDYHSTDKSAEIIKELAPSHWRLMTSKNRDFDVLNCDEEVMDIEKQFDGWKICLNITEFLITPDNIGEKLGDPNQDTAAHACPSVIITGEEYGLIRFPKSQKRMSKHPNDIAELFRGFKQGVLCSRMADDGDSLARPPRYLHNGKCGNYQPGRHKTGHRTYENNLIFTGWLGYFPWNQKTIDRKSQIKSQIPQSDAQKNWGHQHFWSHEQMYNVRRQLVQFSEDLLRYENYSRAYNNVSNLLL